MFDNLCIVNKESPKNLLAGLYTFDLREIISENGEPLPSITDYIYSMIPKISHFGSTSTSSDMKGTLIVYEYV